VSHLESTLRADYVAVCPGGTGDADTPGALAPRNRSSGAVTCARGSLAEIGAVSGNLEAGSRNGKGKLVGSCSHLSLLGHMGYCGTCSPLTHL
jgi:hypothetical protein